MDELSPYCIRITKCGPSGDEFGWAICRHDNSLEVYRSTMTFQTRAEAVLDSVHATATLAFLPGVDSPPLFHEAGEPEEPRVPEAEWFED